MAEKIERTFGKRIGGSRYDRRNPYLMEDMEALDETARVKVLTKNAIWPEPDWVKEAEGLDNEGLLSLLQIKLFRKAIAGKTPTGGRSLRYMKAVTCVRDAFERGDFLDIMTEARHNMSAKKTLSGRFERLVHMLDEAGVEPHDMFSGKWVWGASQNIFKAVPVLESMIKITNFPEKCEESWREDLFIVDTGTAIQPQTSYMKGRVSPLPGMLDPLCYLGQQAGVGSYRYIRKDSAENLYAFIDNELTERMNAKKAGRKASSNVIKVTRPAAMGAERKGPDERDHDVGPEEFLETFQFYGGEFGQWVNNRERQDTLNAAYDALSDLARVLDLPKEAMGMYGTIAAAFGARGHGHAVAHYEPSRKVFNLTKMSGGGALAHEWAHALDQLEGNASRFINTRKHICTEDFENGSRSLDRGRSSAYYSCPEEMFARAFESFVQDALEAKGESSPYLVWGTKNDNYETMNPYPAGQERKEIGDFFKEKFIPFCKLTAKAEESATDADASAPGM